jgi:tRNA-splicing ligase RtcB
MRVPGVVFVSRELLPDVRSDKSLEQVANVATLPGIVRASYARPDMHWGYGFPIGRLAATNVDTDGAVSPGGVGFDISCGVRFLAAPHLDRHGVASRLETAMDGLDRAVPIVVGRGAVWRLGSQAELEHLLVGGDGARSNAATG